MISAKTVDEYIIKSGKWQELLLLLRDIVVETELKEEVKWGGPCYTLDGKNVLGLGAFKSYAGIWFFQGALLSDKKKLLMNASDETKALRQMRFQSIEELNPSIIRAYVKEAIANQKKGKEIPKSSKVPLILHEDLIKLFAKNKKLELEFNRFTPYKQREFNDFLFEAKRLETRQTRIKKIIPMIEAGIGLHDKFRK